MSRKATFGRLASVRCAAQSAKIAADGMCKLVKIVFAQSPKETGPHGSNRFRALWSSALSKNRRFRQSASSALSWKRSVSGCIRQSTPPTPPSFPARAVRLEIPSRSASSASWVNSTREASSIRGSSSAAACASAAGERSTARAVVTHPARSTYSSTAWTVAAEERGRMPPRTRPRASSADVSWDPAASGAPSSPAPSSSTSSVSSSTSSGRGSETTSPPGDVTCSSAAAALCSPPFCSSPGGTRTTRRYSPSPTACDSSTGRSKPALPQSSSRDAGTSPAGR
mmetsp:Transcript_3524/g.12259  ORF Transcript_3524/g.12259 Transcript_3524/m.12259 type:complete len:283 (-) Transcript_3524:116-964(-)